MDGVVLGIDVGTTKICALVGEVRQGVMQIVGVGQAPAQGIRKGVVVDVKQATDSIAAAVEKAEQTSSYDLTRATVSLAGSHIQCSNNRGAVAIGRNGSGVTASDVERALDAAQAVSIPHNREIVHVMPRAYAVDDQRDVTSPIGMQGYRLEVEAHIVTAATQAMQNLSRCVDNVGLEVEEYVLNSLAAAEAVLTPTEREMGVLVADIGGGTTDIALYSEGVVWHTAVIPIGGFQITNDIAIGLHAPYQVAEKIKVQYGDCRPTEIDPTIMFTLEPFGGERIQASRRDLAYVIEARVEELFRLVLEEVKESGYSGMLPAGIVLTGGTAQLRGITRVAQDVLNVPSRVARPQNLVGLVDALHSPSYAASVGLLQWPMSSLSQYRPRSTGKGFPQRILRFLRALIPG